MSRWMAAVGTAGALAMTGVSAHATVSAPNGKLAFAEAVGNQNRLVVANVDGTGQRVLAGLPTPVSQPRWSPDGSRIAFVAGSYSLAELYVVDSDGTNLTRLTRNDAIPDKSPSWTPDGRSIVYQRGNQIWAMNADGSGKHRLTAGTLPAVSPDGHRIAFVRGGRLYVAHSDGHSPRRLTRGHRDTEPSWSPDGTTILFVRRISTLPADLWTIGSTGRPLRRLTNTSDRFESDPAWSPQGDQIVFRGCRTDDPPSCDLFTIAANGASERPFSNDAPTVPLTDDFDRAGIDRSVWNPWINGGGTVDEANGRLEFTLPANPVADSYGNAGAGVTTVCPLHGDFDVQVDYSLLEWPAGVNGANIGLNLWPVPAGFNRTSAPWGPSVYNMWANSSGGGGSTATADASGTMRFVRTGTLYTSYVLDGKSWRKIASGDGDSGDASIVLTLSAHIPDFAHQEVRAALDNFRVNSGRFVCAVDGHWPDWQPAQSPELSDQLAGAQIDSSLWSPFVLGTGPSVAQTHGDLEVAIPADAQNDATRAVFGAGLNSACTLEGDFDLRVDYALLDWPPRNGVRVGLVAGNEAITERVSDIAGLDDKYLLGIGAASYGVTPTTDRTGALRIARRGDLITSYVLANGSWAALAYAPATSPEVGFAIQAWSHDALFGHQDVRVAFSNFRASAHSIDC
jgi:WD40 repeat protein